MAQRASGQPSPGLIYTTGEAVDPQTRPLAILLDGQFWAESMPVWSPLAALTREGRLPPAVYLLIDAIDNQRRGVELPCHRDFWLAVQEELLPLVHGYAPFSDRPDRTVVAGQSFGGLAAMFAALNWPQRFGCVLSQSGSYWWPHRDGRGTGFIGEQLRRGGVRGRAARLAGSGPTRTDHFSREPGATGATHHNTADDFLASG